ncbi:helix-turn-helix domain-containing protein [Sphingosinicella rhizophila]|uniref:Helix-turn-helix transcriptional regulator n=1 Tax=Sphingosinicella rhizophila TaxID=3050082 RepID=A0ABU3QBT9_9SPHN|nr:helix-turn-helix transcriptional regulator [Sphingosinicella sp. GR2756]MDT9600856.1 helix-turn-helix transcriptional regulator [Sphingosinicella sp. GR2756]
MKTMIFPGLGRQLKQARARRKLTQPALGRRLGRDRARISELERDLVTNRLGRDRLTLFAEICDALDLIPVLVPRAQAGSILAAQEEGTNEFVLGRSHRSTFDEVFVDLADEDDKVGDD